MPRCPECGLGYVPEVPEDAKYHRIYHDKKVNGIRYRRAKSEKVIWEEGGLRITVANFFSPMPQRIRAQEVGLLAWDDTEFSFGRYHSREDLDARNIHNFLLYRKNRVIGLLIAERRSYIDRFTWEEYDKAGGQKLTERSPIWSIGYVWILKKHIRKGLARKLVFEAVSSLGTDMQSIGWYVPFTESGRPLVKSLCPDYFWVAM